MDPSNLPPDVDRAGALYAIMYAPLFFTILFVTLRLWIRKMKSLGMDDSLAVVSLLVFMGGIMLCTYYVTRGGCRHIFYLTPSQVVEAVKLNVVAQAFGIVGPVTGKLSVGLLMLRIIGPNSVYRRWYLYLSMGLYALWSFLILIFTYTQCRPTSALWDPTPDMKCWSRQVFPDIAISQSAMGTFIDFTYALLPIKLVVQLKVSIKRKIGLAVLLGMGVFAGVASALKTQHSEAFANQTDPTWATFDIFVWNIIETHLVLLCGCLPTLRPIYERIANKRKIGPPGANSRPTGGISSRGIAKKFFSKSLGTTTTTTASSDNAWINLPDRSNDRHIIVQNTVDIDRGNSYTHEVDV